MSIERIPIENREQWLKRFEALYMPEPNSGCWLWLGTLSKAGYGQFWWGNDGIRMISAHRASWRLFVGQIEDGLHVLHRCDNRPCVNPAHLFLGTHQDNVDDCVAKGRQTRMFGEQNGPAKLTDATVRSIRNDNRSQRTIAAKHGVDQSTVSLVKQGKIWRHVD